MTGSPSTTANGISACCGGGSAASASASSCEPVFSTSFSSVALSPVVHAHRLMHFLERLARDVARLLAAFGDDAAHEVAILLEFLRALRGSP